MELTLLDRVNLHKLVYKVCVEFHHTHMALIEENHKAYEEGLSKEARLFAAVVDFIEDL